MRRMQTRNLGSLTVSAIGYGAMVLENGMYGAADDERSLATLRHAIDAGATLLDTADAYGAGHNEQLVARAIAGRRDEVQLATKWAIVAPGEGRRLSHHAEQVLAAHQVHPVAAVQAEYSLWTRDPERELLPTLRELGIGFVCWSPLGAGFFAGSADRIGAPGADFRSNHPRFSAENLAANRDRYAPLRGLAAELGITPAQLALAWLLHRGDDVVPIPGTRTPSHLDENLGAADVSLDAATLARIDELAPAGAAAGASL